MQQYSVMYWIHQSCKPASPSSSSSSSCACYGIQKQLFINAYFRDATEAVFCFLLNNSCDKMKEAPETFLELFF